MGAPLSPLAIVASTLESESSADMVLTALDKYGWICVPKIPNNEMLDAAYWCAYEENAAGVWEEMIAVIASSYPVNNVNSGGSKGYGLAQGGHLMDRVALENDLVILSALREVLEMVVPRERLVGRGLIEQLTARLQVTAEALAVCSPDRPE